MTVVYSALTLKACAVPCHSEANEWVSDIMERAKKLKVNAGHIAGTDVGPVISPAAKKRVEDLIQSAVDEGATLLLDGRGVKVPGYEKGNFVGPTIITNVKPHMRCYQEEIFGPVLICLDVDTLDDAISLVNSNRCVRSGAYTP